MKIQQALRGTAAKLSAGAALVAGSGLALAADPMDTTDIVATISAAATNVAAIGGAVLSVLVVAMVFKWVRKAF